jgi:hypothetical protein
MKIKRTVALATLFALFTIQVDAQLKTWLTLESGPQWSMLKVADPGGYFQGANVRSYVWGITLGQEVLPNLTISTGVLNMTQKDGINMIDERINQSSWLATSSILIPLRVEYLIRPTEYPVCFTPRIGYVYNIIKQPDALYSASSILSAPDGAVLSYQLQQLDDRSITHMLEVGMGLNIWFPNSWQASVNLSYLTGLQGSPASIFTLDYSDETGNNSSTEYTSKGNTLLTTLALNIPVSNIWQNRDYRIRARIEHSVYKGKPVTRRGQVYLGGEVGSLWRLFNSSNPAVGARPMDDRGFFQYANLHTGIYAGYMITDDLGFDIGANYQRSSTFYAIMYDHEVDFTTRMPAPLYLEFPLRFRYFYNVYKEKIYLAFYGGASLLTHFSREVYNQGAADFTYTSPTTSEPTTATTTFEASGVRSVAPLLRLGTGVEYKLPIDFPLIATLYVNYMQGYMDMGQIEITNTLTETPPVSSVTYDGSGWSVDIGIKVPFRFGDGGKCGQLPEREK